MNNITFNKPASFGNQFIKKYQVPNEDTLDYIFGYPDYTYNILEGPVRSGKTTDNITAFCMALEKSPDPLHLTIGVSQGSARNILWESDGLGIAHYPDWQERTQVINGKRVRFRQRIFKTQYQGFDALALLPKKNSNHPIKYIVAFGGSSKSDHETYVGWSVGMILATQWELLHKNTRHELMNRTIASRYRKFFIDLNPISPKAEIYKEFEIWQRANQVNYKLKLMEENPILDETRIEEIKQQYDPESIEYKRNILGQRVAPEGLIYTVRDYNIIDSYNTSDYRKIVAVADIGETNSATTFVLLGITKDLKNIDVIKEYYHRNANEKNELMIKMPIDYAKDYQEFIKQVYEEYGRIPDEILSDNDITFVREYERTKYSANLGATYLNHTFGKDEINDRIKLGINLLYTKRLRFYKNCENTIEAFKTASYDEKAKDRGKYVRYDSPKDGTMIDPIDAVEYGLSRFKYEIDNYRG